MAEFADQHISNRYRLVEKLGAGGMGEVYRAYDRLHRQNVALKRVLQAIDQLDLRDKMDSGTTYAHIALAHEFQVLASLRHPNIISVLDYGFDEEQQSFFTMALLEGARPITKAGKDQSQEFKTRLLIEMLQALAYLHQRGIVHRDLKPDNALVTAENQVKVLDFGISTKREQADQQKDESVSGTLAYIAPEVLQGGRATEKADLYAVGVMAYELFVGKHPFDLSNPGTLIQDILFKVVDTRGLNLNDDLSYLLQRLLQKEPDGRFSSAQDIIARLSEAAELTIPIETSDIRESFLQAARFVGRETQLALLVEALLNAQKGAGSLWLIGGETGVGKSRLLDELRTQALVRGALVLVGRGVEEGGFTYEMWREPLRRLALAADLSDFEAGVLKQIVPDMAELLGHPIPDAPELEGQPGQQRLLSTISDVLRRQKQLTVLLLEDLHWAAESLDVLKQINLDGGSLPLLIVADFRDDEKPNLPSELPNGQTIRLERLSDESISELSASMLGSAGSEVQIVDLLKREAEGNVFFLIEAVRALAEQAGQLNKISEMTLPRSIISGGVQQIINRRLARIPGQGRALLRYAALAGRQLDLKLLHAIDSQLDLEEWLTICSNAGVLEVQDERWRFAHDKLREGLLTALSADEQQALHQKIAATLEATYADEADDYAAKISDHYERAGDYSKAADWYARAGKHAQASYAPASAIEYYQQALALWTEHGAPQNATLQLETYHGLGEVLYFRARYAEATENYNVMLAAAQTVGNVIFQIRAWRGLAVVQMYQGRFREALDFIAHAEAIPALASEPTEQAKIGWLKGWCRFYMGEIDVAHGLAEQLLQLNEKRGDQVQIAQNLNLLTAIHGTLGRYDQAAEECKRALAIFEEVGDRGSALFQVGNLGMIAGKRGDHLAAIGYFEDGLARARQLGRRDGEMLYLTNLGGAHVQNGDAAAAERELRQVIEIAQTTRFGQLAETYCFLADAYRALGQADQAIEAAQQALILANKSQNAEVMAATWRTLGKTAALVGVPLSLMLTQDRSAHFYPAAACFAESEKICLETGMEGERAQTLRAWAQYDLDQGETESGKKRWYEARDIFTRIGATLEAARMPDLAT